MPDPTKPEGETRRCFKWSSSNVLNELKRNTLLRPIRRNHILIKRRHIGAGDYWLRRKNGEETIISVVDPGHSYDYYLVYTDYLQEVYRIFIEAHRRVHEQQAVDVKDIVRPILSKRVENKIETTVFEFCQAIKEFGNVKGFGNRGMIFSGPPGTGKSETMRWLADYCYHAYNRSATKLSYAELIKALQNGSEISSSRMMIFIDDIDVALLRDRREPDSHPLTSQFLTCVDGLHKREGRIMIISTNERIDKIDPALRRPGRFETLVHFEYPTLDLITEFCKSREVDMNPKLFKGWSFARLDLFIARYKVANFLHGSTIEGYYEQFIHEMGANDETVEAYCEVDDYVA